MALKTFDCAIGEGICTDMKAIMNDQIPLSIGGGIGQSRVFMLLLRKAHLGEVSVTLWPPELKKICTERNIHVLQ